MHDGLNSLLAKLCPFQVMIRLLNKPNPPGSLSPPPINPGAPDLAGATALLQQALTEGYGQALHISRGTTEALVRFFTGLHRQKKKDKLRW